MGIILFAFQQDSWLSILKYGFILDKKFDGDSQPLSFWSSALLLAFISGGGFHGVGKRPLKIWI